MEGSPDRYARIPPVHHRQFFRRHAARTGAFEADEIDRARSATEAFLYHQLQTLSATAGRFRLNAELPIPFDGNGRMEVDLLCAEARLAIELDGAQHLDSPEAYRRDRRKDLHLQKHGYFVLRFLAEDVGKHLDSVLDTILRALSHHQQKAMAASEPNDRARRNSTLDHEKGEIPGANQGSTGSNEAPG